MVKYFVILQKKDFLLAYKLEFEKKKYPPPPKKKKKKQLTLTCASVGKVAKKLRRRRRTPGVRIKTKKLQKINVFNIFTALYVSKGKKERDTIFCNIKAIF